MSDLRLCAVIPAAGRGTRLGFDIPKILLPIRPGLTVWHLLKRSLDGVTDDIHVIVSPSGEEPFRRTASDASVSVQEQPLGMGDAIFGAARFWATFDAILVIWGDQVHLTPSTVRRTVEAYAGSSGPHIALPLVEVVEPYVEYELAGSELRRVLMSREGDSCRPHGLSDVGVFCLSVDGLAGAWGDYAAGAAPGRETGEINFLPFLSYLSTTHRWPVTVVPGAHPRESRGINTLDDLTFAREVIMR